VRGTTHLTLTNAHQIPSQVIIEGGDEAIYLSGHFSLVEVRTNTPIISDATIQVLLWRTEETNFTNNGEVGQTINLFALHAQ